MYNLILLLLLMPTDVISKVGATNSPTTMDYSTLQAWEDASPANLVTADQRWIGECYDQGTFTLNNAFILTVSGQTVDATRYVILRCAAGASFKDKAGVRTTPLKYDNTKGVSIEGNAAYTYLFSISADYTQIVGLQISTLTSNNVSGVVRFNNTGHVVDSCIIECKTNQGGYSNVGCGVHTLIKNSLILTGGTGNCIGAAYGGRVECYNSTLIGSAGTSKGVRITYSGGGTPIVKNTAVFNCGGGAFSGGTYTSSSGYNACDDATAPGANSLLNLIFSSQFVSTTDFRAVATGSLKAGTPDSTNAPTDITGLTRDATTPYIGAWEVAGAAFVGDEEGLTYSFRYNWLESAWEKIRRLLRPEPAFAAAIAEEGRIAS